MEWLGCERLRIPGARSKFGTERGGDMKALRVDEKSEARHLVITDEPTPQVGIDEVQISVRAAGVNRADLLQRAGKYPPPEGISTIIGLEVAGIVEAVGDGVEQWKKGDRVCALLAGGGYAETVVVPAGQVMHIPRSLTFAEAAAIPEAFITAYTNLFVEGGLQEGERILVHGGSSGVGTAAIQLATLAVARVSCTVGSEEKASRCRELGASVVVNYKEQDFETVVKEWSDEGIDLILDIVGAGYFERNLALLAQGGRLVEIATMSGSRAEIDIALLMRKRARIIGSVLRSRSAAEKAGLVAGFVGRFFHSFDTGDLKPIVDSVFPFERAEEAHALMKSSSHIGKIVLSFGAV
jgi:putative PIG3 family NAD(P)H quinone oxidoreductase